MTFSLEADPSDDGSERDQSAQARPEYLQREFQTDGLWRNGAPDEIVVQFDQTLRLVQGRRVEKHGRRAELVECRGQADAEAIGVKNIRTDIAAAYSPGFSACQGFRDPRIACGASSHQDDRRAAG